MINVTGNRWQLRAAALAIFLLGAAAGALAPRAYRSWIGREPQRAQFEETIQRLQLDAGQETQVRQILTDTREQFRALRREAAPREQEIRQRADERLRRVLTAEQWQRFQQEMAERRGSRRGRGGGGGRPRG
jgi:Spy/CpxP family protein refolding chaperone